MKILKLKFFKIKTSLKILDFVRLINQNSYTNEQVVGFEIYTYDDNKIKAKFIEKIKSIEIIIDPFNNEQEISIIRYSYFDFEMIFQNGILYLKIINPPKAMKNFFKLLADISKRNAFKEVINLDVKYLYDEIIKLKQVSRYLVPKIKLIEIPLSKLSTAKIEIFSTNNAYDEFVDMDMCTEYIVEKIKLSLRFNNNSESIELSSLGLITVSSGFENEIEMLICI